MKPFLKLVTLAALLTTPLFFSSCEEPTDPNEEIITVDSLNGGDSLSPLDSLIIEESSGTLEFSPGLTGQELTFDAPLDSGVNQIILKSSAKTFLDTLIEVDSAGTYAVSYDFDDADTGSQTVQLLLITEGDTLKSASQTVKISATSFLPKLKFEGNFAVVSAQHPIPEDESHDSVHYRIYGSTDLENWEEIAYFKDHEVDIIYIPDSTYYLYTKATYDICHSYKPGDGSITTTCRLSSMTGDTMKVTRERPSYDFLTEDTLPTDTAGDPLELKPLRNYTSAITVDTLPFNGKVHATVYSYDGITWDTIYGTRFYPDTVGDFLVKRVMATDRGIFQSQTVKANLNDPFNLSALFEETYGYYTVRFLNPRSSLTTLYRSTDSLNWDSVYIDDNPSFRDTLPPGEVAYYKVVHSLDAPCSIESEVLSITGTLGRQNVFVQRNFDATEIDGATFLQVDISKGYLTDEETPLYNYVISVSDDSLTFNPVDTIAINDSSTVTEYRDSTIMPGTYFVRVALQEVATGYQSVPTAVGIVDISGLPRTPLKISKVDAIQGYYPYSTGAGVRFKMNTSYGDWTADRSDSVRIYRGGSRDNLTLLDTRRLYDVSFYTDSIIGLGETELWYSLQLFNDTITYQRTVPLLINRFQFDTPTETLTIRERADSNPIVKIKAYPDQSYLYRIVGSDTTIVDSSGYSDLEDTLTEAGTYEYLVTYCDEGSNIFVQADLIGFTDIKSVTYDGTPLPPSALGLYSLNPKQGNRDVQITGLVRPPFDSIQIVRTRNGGEQTVIATTMPEDTLVIELTDRLSVENGDSIGVYGYRAVLYHKGATYESPETTTPLSDSPVFEPYGTIPVNITKTIRFNPTTEMITSAEDFGDRFRVYVMNPATGAKVLAGTTSTSQRDETYSFSKPGTYYIRVELESNPTLFVEGYEFTVE